jgi:hypothetical protein
MDMEELTSCGPDGDRCFKTVEGVRKHICVNHYDEIMMEHELAQLEDLFEGD